MCKSKHGKFRSFARWQERQRDDAIIRSNDSCEILKRHFKRKKSYANKQLESADFLMTAI